MRRWHRRLGLASAIVVVMLVLTGLALNHTDGLGLSNRNLAWNWLANWYGIGNPSVTDVYIAGTERVAWMDGSLYAGDELLAEGLDRPVGVTAALSMIFVIAPHTLTLFDESGLQIEHVYLDREVERAGPVTPDGMVLRTSEGLVLMDAETLSLSDYSGDFFAWLQPIEMPAEEMERWHALHRSRLVTLERFLLDLHSGRILGIAGVWLIDFFAISFLVLAISGIVVWGRGRGARGNRARRTPRQLAD